MSTDENGKGENGKDENGSGNVHGAVARRLTRAWSKLAAEAGRRPHREVSAVIDADPDLDAGDAVTTAVLASFAYWAHVRPLLRSESLPETTLFALSLVFIAGLWTIEVFEVAVSSCVDPAEWLVAVTSVLLVAAAGALVADGYPLRAVRLHLLLAVSLVVAVAATRRLGGDSRS